MKSVTPLVRIAALSSSPDNTIPSDLGPTALADFISVDHNPDATLLYVEGKPCSNWLSEYPTEIVQQYQEQAHDLAPILHWLEKNIEPTQSELRLHSRATRSLWLCRQCFKFSDGVLYYKFIGCPSKCLCLIVPVALRKEVLVHCHDTKTAGH